MYAHTNRQRAVMELIIDTQQHETATVCC